MTDEKFYKTYPELSEFKEKLFYCKKSQKKIQKLEIINLKDKYLYQKFIVIQNGCDNYCSFCLTIHKEEITKHYERNYCRY